MFTARQEKLLNQAISEIDQLLNSFDPVGQIEVALPFYRKHRHTLIKLRNSSCTPPMKGLLHDSERWRDDICAVFRAHGGQAPHPVLYREVERLRKAAGRSWPPNAHETIRQTLQAYNTQSSQYRDGPDLFRMVRRGLWRLKDFGTH